MVPILRFFVTYASLVYGALVVGILLASRGLFLALREKRKAVFGLEQEITMSRVRQSLAVLLVIILLVAGEVILQAFLVPSLPGVTALSTPTLNLLAVPTTTLSPELLASLGSATAPPPSTSEASGCIPGQISITSPKPGENVSGTVEIMGTASIPNFGYFKYEFSVVGSANWATVNAIREPKQDEKLGDWDTSQLATGDYLLRLVVTDNQDNALPACVVPVHVTGQ
jgi:hypothetical protein